MGICKQYSNIYIYIYKTKYARTRCKKTICKKNAKQDENTDAKICKNMQKYVYVYAYAKIMQKNMQKICKHVCKHMQKYVFVYVYAKNMQKHMQTICKQYAQQNAKT